MGILNVTPDSFSDGGRFFNYETAVVRALELMEAGADILDIGGESTRPGAAPVSEEEEMSRVLPVIKEVAGRAGVTLSIDTIKPAVAEAAVRAGAGIINDIAANREEERMWRVVAETGAGYVAMHMQGRPPTMQKNPVYADVIEEVNEFFGERLNRLAGAGVRAEQIVLDVGIGFGKTAAHNLRLLGQMRRFTKWGRPVLLGVSRKSFIGQVTGAKVDERLPGSLACACLAVEQGVGIIRTHDVAATRQAVRVTEAILARRQDVGSFTE